ncbi:MAG: cyclic pyranopterin monophosphate synthase MoaC [Peptococcaceae bacterium]|nr:cyclic pyranopterin monophosphate synthase MoaC [Peptococcaceae bacterium]
METAGGELTHFDRRGKARMVDVSAKDVTLREAVARAEVIMKPETLELVKTGGAAKGDVLGVARVAGIMAAKETGRLIPMAHPINLTAVNVDFRLHSPDKVLIEARVRTTGKTGVEMEALTAAGVAALTIYDMCKAVDRGMVINNVRLVEKTGGKSGTYRRKGEEPWGE